jgi:UDP-2,3-diacylglucosamine pyrophosphatase LpxH
MKKKIDEMILDDISFQVVSDLHIEYKNNNIPDPLHYIKPVAKMLILAGDIGSLYKFNQLRGFLQKLCIHFELVLYVPGNHEFYMQHDCNTHPVSMDVLVNKLQSLENEIDNLYILNRTSIVLNNICITGCTLWSKAEVKIPKFIVRIHGMTTEIYNKYHYNDLKYINRMIEYCKNNNLKLIVVTHHCPSFNVMDNTYKMLLNDDNTMENFRKKDRYVSLYFSNLDNLLRKDKVHTWICGHIHQNFDYITNGGTRLVGNQYGKPRDNVDDYSKEFVVKIEEEDDEFLQEKKFQYCSEPILNDGKNDFVLVI